MNDNSGLKKCWSKAASMATGVFVATVTACSIFPSQPNLQGTIEAQQTQIVQLGGPTQPPPPTTPTASAPVAEPENLSPQLTIIPFNYALNDVGDGWNEGEVSLAFTNLTNQIIIPTKWEFPSGAIVETQEGVTYPATIIRHGSYLVRETTDIELYDDYDGPSGPIPPGFRFGGIGHDARYYVSWKSATAATPKRVSFPDHPELNFDLPSQQRTKPSFPFDSPPVAVKSFSSLQNTKLTSDPSGIEATFTGRCGNVYWYEPASHTGFEYPEMLFLEVTVLNNDKFNERTGQFSLPFTLFLRNGRIHHYDNAQYSNVPTDSSNEPGSITLGPGQRQTGYLVVLQFFLRLEENEEPPIVIFWSEDDYDVYDAKECGFKEGGN